jgi:coenzyme PQQ precursor peptide PqqA
VRNSGIQPGAIALGTRRHRRLFNDSRRQTMKWETPTACDFRFGFEITMYIAAR